MSPVCPFFIYLPPKTVSTALSQHPAVARAARRWIFPKVLETLLGSGPVSWPELRCSNVAYWLGTRQAQSLELVEFLLTQLGNRFGELFMNF